MHRILWCAVAVLASSPALAQDTEEVPEGRLYEYRKRTEIDIDDGIEITGQHFAPGIILEGEPRRPVFNPLIKLRDDWAHEMADSVDEIR